MKREMQYIRKIRESDEMIAETFSSAHGMLEDQPRMIVEQPFMCSYWEDKAARLENITVPAYVVASYTNSVHTHGTFAGYRRISIGKKWLTSRTIPMSGTIITSPEKPLEVTSSVHFL